MMEEKRGFRVPHQLGYFASNRAVGDGNLVCCDRHWASPVGLIRPFLERWSRWPENSCRSRLCGRLVVWFGCTIDNLFDQIKPSQYTEIDSHIVLVYGDLYLGL